MKIILVCHGNTCRSPMAEAIFKSYTDDVEVVSAGLSAGGESASLNAVKVCEKYNLDIKSHKSTSIYDVKIEDDDLILALTYDIADELRKLYPNNRIYTLRQYAGESQYLDIKDPVGGDGECYEDCFNEIKECIRRIVEKYDF